MKADWNNNECRRKYNELSDKKPEDLTEEEKDFCHDMYHQEEYYAGLL